MTYRGNASSYLGRISTHLTEADISPNVLNIMSFRISNKSLSTLKKIDLRPPMSDVKVDEWMDIYSLYGKGTSHNLDYVIRGTDVAPEHYFSKDIYNLFKIGRISKK